MTAGATPATGPDVSGLVDGSPARLARLPPDHLDASCRAVGRQCGTVSRIGKLLEAVLVVLRR